MTDRAPELVADTTPAAVTLPVPLLASLCDALARATTPARAFDAIGNATAALLGPGLLTINAYRRASSEVVRLWSSDKATYPVGGSKRKADTPWTRWVLHQAEVFVGESDAALEAVFDDIAVIRGLGLSAVVNVPVCEHGRCVGTFNFLAARGAWTEREVATLRLLAQLVAPAVLSASQAAQAGS
jgi:GAF domain-containing protein